MLEITDKKIPLVIITGPTAVGKTSSSVAVAKRLNGEIISADSMQVYRGMDIGTAKITEAEKQGIRHYLIDEFEPDEDFNVTVFKERALKYIGEIYSKGKLPIIAGGTGFYIQSVLYDVEFSEYDDDEMNAVKQELQKELEEKGIDYIYDRLKKTDPEYAAIIHKNNTRRVINGIAFNSVTGKKLSEHNDEQRVRTSPFDFRYIVINDDKACLYDRINKRVDRMIENGLVEEVKYLLFEKKYSRQLPSMLGLGYKEISDFLCNECSLEKAVELIKRDTRHFAKKQLTWFKRERSVTEIYRPDYTDEGAMLEKIIETAAEVL